MLYVRKAIYCAACRLTLNASHAILHTAFIATAAAILVSVSESFAKTEVVYSSLSYNCECPYTATRITDQFLFGLDNIGLCPIDTIALAKALFASLSDSEASNSGVDHATNLFLISSYKFEGDSNWLLLKYRWTHSVTSVAFVGYVRSTGRWGVIWNGVGNPIAVKDGFNRMVGEAPDALKGIRAECKAMMVVSTVYGGRRPVFVIDTRDDIHVAEVSDIPYKRELEGPLDRSLLYCIYPSKDSILAANARQPWLSKNWDSEWMESVDSAGLIGAVQTKADGSKTKVELTVFETDNDEVARWRFVFDRDGKLVTMGYAQEPVIRLQEQAYDYSTGTYSKPMPYRSSPYYYLREAE